MSIPQQKTDTLGYYNPHTYPLSIEIPGTGERLELNPGGFINTQLSLTDPATGNVRSVTVTVNDPGLMPLVNPRILARKVASSPVRVISWPGLERLRRRMQADGFAPGASYNPVTTLPTFETDATGKIILPKAVGTHQPGAPVASPVVQGLTMAEAARLGIDYTRPSRAVTEADDRPTPTPPAAAPKPQAAPKILTAEDIPEDILEGTDTNGWAPPDDMNSVITAAATKAGVTPITVQAPVPAATETPAVEQPAEVSVTKAPAAQLPPAVPLPAPKV